MKNSTRELLNFIDNSPTAYHAVANISAKLLQAGFEELSEKDEWKIKKGGRYFVTRNGSSLVAFTMPESETRAINMAAAHSDSPCFKLKSNPEIVGASYVSLNTEKYGGMIMPSWLDRPLSVAGRIAVKEAQGNKITYKLVNLKKDVAIIPNLAIHMNSDVNNGKKYDAQVDMIPLIGSEKCAGNLMKLVARDAKVKENEILGADLFLYNDEKGRIWGIEDEYISAPRLDDLQCAFSLIKGLINSGLAHENAGTNKSSTAGKKADEGNLNNKILNKKINLVAVFDNEEVGSTTRQGADSTFLSDVIDRMIPAGKRTQILAESFMISADNAHAVHPNHPEVADPTNRPLMNKGIVIKHNANQKYTTDAISEGTFVALCQEAGVEYQHYCNKSNIAGGSTLGNISTSHVSVSTVDIGLPQLAMHSCFETAGATDADSLIKVMEKYWG